MRTRAEILREIEVSVFRAITDADWERELRAARARENQVRARIQKILAEKQKLNSEKN
jgi:hypothetical protein